MCFLFSFVPATVFLGLGYLVFVSSKSAEGVAQTLGRVLMVWVFVLAVFFPICGAYVTLAGVCPIEQILPMR